MRNSTLDQMVEALRIEARLSTDSSRGVESRPWLTQLINRWYETLWNDYEWQHLRVLREESTLPLQAGQRFYQVPESLESDSITDAFVKFGGVWNALGYGVGAEQYSQIDSDLDARNDPAQRWTIRSYNEIEVWPIPATNDALLGFEGTRKFSRMTTGSDRCLLDDTVVILFAAAEVLAANKQADAKNKEQSAGTLLARLRARSSGNGRVRMGLGRADDERRAPREIRVAYVRNQ